MQKFWNIASPIIILALGVWIFFLIRANMKWKDLMTKATAEAEAPKKAVNGAELWSALQEKIQEIKLDVTLNNNNQ